MQINFHQATFQLNSHHQFNIENLAIHQNDFWVIVGGNGSGKTVFSQILQKKLPLVKGEYTNSFEKIALLSFEEQQKIVEKVFNDRNNDFIGDEFGFTAKQFILEHNNNEVLCDYYAKQLGIEHFLERPFIQLSTGESRKVLLCQMLVNEPDLLILDEPFEGLDKQSVQDWAKLLNELHHKMTLVLIINRLNDIPLQATHIALLDQLAVCLQGEKSEVEQLPLFQQLRYAETAQHIALPDPAMPVEKLDPNINPFELKNVIISYSGKTILDKLSWTIQPKQHWWIKGENGAGKSTLLSVLTGDHPQAFSNRVILFGKQRGSGETIWDIKKNIGYLSSQLHLDYRVSCSVLEVIVSGFFDSIGVYQKIPDSLKIKAMEWLTRLNLQDYANKPFKSLSWGQQRLLLITRAMVKHPPILILDEPLQGLDGLNRQLVKNFISQLIENSETQLLFVSHQDQDAPDCITHIFEFVKQGEGYIYQKQAVTS